MGKFRHDINALRALAVTAVVLYHFKVAAIPGGFVGVDVFFVISGYLMTQIIMTRLQSDSFSLRQFYYDRANRIVPGLATLCACLIVFGFFFIDPFTYNRLTYSTIPALLFYSNYIFQSWTGYFEQTASTQWLLHTWSLSVEWQFYMIYPIFLYFLFRSPATRKHSSLVIGLMALASFLYCVASSKNDPSAAFYFLPQRAWELLAGGIVALRSGACPQRLSGIAFAGGLALIGVSLLGFDDIATWPDYRAVLPVFGACLVIAAHRAPGLLIRNPVVQGIGKWSYSTYLWHWPIAVGFLYFGVAESSALDKLLVLCLVLAPAIAASALMRGTVLPRSLVLGRGRALSDPVEPESSSTLLFYRIFASMSPLRSIASEMRTRAAVRFAGKCSRLRPVLVLAPFLVALSLALVVNTYRGFPNRRPDGAEQVRIYKLTSTDWVFPRGCDGRDPAGRLRPCELGPPARRGALIIGDSHAMQLYNRFVETATSRLDRSLTFLVSSGCPMVPRARFIADTYHCNGFIDDALRFAETKDFERLVLVSSWHGYFSPENDTICIVEGARCSLERVPDRYYRHLDEAFADLRARLLEFRRKGQEIVIIAATPFGKWDVPSELLKRQFRGIDTREIESIDRATFAKSSDAVNSRLRALAASIDASFIDPVDFLCDARLCPTLDDQGVPYFFDKAHYRSGVVRDDRFRFYDEAIGSGRQ
jgi:peptidoglycan/LPS O-acetylase OafA/YrhL